MIENRFVTSESGFVEMAAWDRCVNPALGAVVSNTMLPVWIGVDASVKHDLSAVVVVAHDSRAQQVRLVFHRVFQPTPDEPLDFEATIEATLLDLAQRFQLRKVLFDPYQMQATAQRLERAGLPIEEFPQSSPNLTAASQNLYELIQGGALVCYPDASMRLAVSRAVALETPRGWRISKATQSHKIDVVVALAMAAYAAVQSQHEPFFDHTFAWVDTDSEEDSNRAWQAQRTAAYCSVAVAPASAATKAGAFARRGADSSRSPQFLTLIKLDPAENVPLLAPLLDVPLPKERTLTLASPRLLAG
jgi:phage terminase large subunit-like protein